MINSGKIFESKFRENWQECFPGSFLFRLPDQVSGYKTTSQNPCDFFAFTHRALFLIECKSHDGASIPFSAMPQFERLLAYKNIPYIFPGFVIWFKEKDKVIWVPISTAEDIYKSGAKSIQLKMLTNKLYNILELPSTKKRVYMDTDYRALIDFCELS